MDFGCTGTDRGMTPAQKNQAHRMLLNVYRNCKRLHPTEQPRFHHGGCIGADEQMAKMAKEIGFWVICHPGIGKDGEVWHRFRCEFVSDETLKPKPFLERNHDIVDICEFIIATPRTAQELPRSGTWATIRYCQKINRKCAIIPPEGFQEAYHV